VCVARSVAAIAADAAALFYRRLFELDASLQAMFAAMRPSSGAS
jgi:hypothetical protein